MRALKPFQLVQSRLSTPGQRALWFGTGSVCIFALLGIMMVISHESSFTLVAFDQDLARFFLETRTDRLTPLFFFVTQFGSSYAIFFTAVAASLLMRRSSSLLIGTWFTLWGTAASVYLLKLSVWRIRPTEEIALYLERTFSFPSGHAALSLALYGFLTYTLARHCSGIARIGICVIGAVPILLIGLSRLYLGVHYFSDIIGGWLIAAAWLSMGIVIAELTRTRQRK